MKKITVQLLQRYRVVIQADESGGYYATCPILPGCCSQGETFAETKRNIREAIRCYLESLVIDASTWCIIEQRRKGPTVSLDEMRRLVHAPRQ